MDEEDVRTERRAAPRMEGAVARQYDRIRGSRSQIEEYRRQAEALAAELPSGAQVLEVAPGPGYFAIELARQGCRVTGLDLSRTMVEIAVENARRASVPVLFRQGDVGQMPFDPGAFDLVICQAAFKNFPRPVAALDEMHRVLRPGGTAIVDDMSSRATSRDIADEIRRMHIGWFGATMTRISLAGLRRRAYTPEQFQALARRSAFGACDVVTGGIGMRVRLTKSAQEA